jgi:hypothetical protein
MDNSIAFANLFGQDKHGHRFPIKVEIGAPFQTSDDSETWRCSVQIDPLYSHLRDIAGADGFQALCLASQLAVSLLRGFVEDGGRLLHDDGTDFALNAYAPKDAQ